MKTVLSHVSFAESEKAPSRWKVIITKDEFFKILDEKLLLTPQGEDYSYSSLLMLLVPPGTCGPQWGPLPQDLCIACPSSTTLLAKTPVFCVLAEAHPPERWPAYPLSV